MTKRILIWGIVAAGFSSLGIGSLVFVGAQKRVFEMPHVISTSAPVQVLGAKLIDQVQNGSEPSAKIFLKNNSDKKIIAFTVESGNEKDTDGYSLVNISDEAGPIAWQRAEFSIEVPIGNFLSEGPLRINAIVFDDGSSAGEPVPVQQLKKLVDKVFESKGRRVDPE